MLITVNGLVVRERSVGEADKFIEILTAEYGIIEVSAKGARKITSSSGAAAQLFAYSKFCIKKRGERYYINSSEPIKIFYDLRLDIEKLSLAYYFSELVCFSATSQQPNGEILRLFLNTLHFLSSGTRSKELLKSIFEMRLMTEIGMMPDLLACKYCLAYEKDVMYLNINSGELICKDCLEDGGYSDDDLFLLDGQILHALRYIVLTDFEKLFSFNLSGRSLERLGLCTERFALSHLGRNFKTLDFYKSTVKGST